MPSSSSGTRPHKLQKLNDLRRSTPYVSQTALQALLEKIHQEGVPELKQRKAMKEATRAELAKMSHYGPLLLQCPCTTPSGQSIPINMANTNSMLAGAYHQGGSWANMLAKTHQEQPSSFSTPWQLLLYSDEVVPGNALANRLERKTLAIYGSFGQFGHFLQYEDAWFILCLARSPEVTKLSGNISQVFSKLLETIFLSQVANPRHGLLLPHGQDSSQDIKLYFTMGGWVQDGLAMKQTFSTKGDSGDKFCLLCSNIRSQAMPTTPGQPFLEEDILGSTVCTLAECALSTDQEVLQAFQDCQHNAATMTREDFQLYQQAAGISHCPQSLLLNQAGLL